MNPKDVTSGPTTSAGGPQGAERDLGGHSGAVPDVRLLPDGRVAWHLPADIPEDGPRWLSTSTSGRPYWFSAEELPLADSQRLVPVGPLLAYVADLDIRAAIAEELAEGTSADCMEGYAGKAEAREQCAKALRHLLTSLLGEAPEPTAQEGDHG